MQAKLPDVNAAIVRYRSQAIESAQKPETYDLAVIMIGAINADLPEDFKVEINSEKYYSMIEDRRYVLCSHCTTIDKNPESSTYQTQLPTECILADVEKYEIELDWKEQILANKKTQEYWICTKCKEQNVMEYDKIKLKKYQMPFYTKVMPEPPSRRRGIHGRNSYDNAFKKWFEIALQEIESQISRYRTEYAAQQEEQEVNILEA